MQNKLQKLSKVEMFCLLLTVMAIAHLLIGGNWVIAGIEFLIVIIVYNSYAAKEKDSK